MTKEERSAAAKARAAERRKEQIEMERKYPRARLSQTKQNGTIQIYLTPTSPLFLTIRYAGNPWVDELDCKGWSATTLRIDSISDLSELIAALTCRYNELARESNTNIDKCKMLKLAEISEAR